MKVITFNTESVKPVKLKHSADKTLVYKGEPENFNFGLHLQTYNVFEDIKDRSTNYNTAYFLSDLYSLSSIIELDTPYTLTSDSKFTTYLKNGDNYAKASSSSSELTYDSNFNTLSSQYFFTLNISTNRYLYITKEINDTTYYAYCSSELIYLSADVPSVSSHLFEFVVQDNKLKLFPYKDIANPSNKYQVIFSNVLELTGTTAGNVVSSVIDINRNVLTKLKGSLNNTFSYYISSFNRDNVGLNLNTTTKTVSNNYLGFTNNYTLNYSSNDWCVDFDTLPLKNQATLEEYYSPNNHYNSQPSNLNREYEKIFSGNNQNEGYDKLYLSYNIGTKDIHFPPSKLTYFTTPSSISPYTKLNINDSKIDNIGAIPGNNPLVADKVFKRRFDFKNNNFTDDVNATYLCSWLSGNTDGDRLWVDRYYNPDSINFSDAMSGTAFYNTVTSASAQTTHVFDISSRLTFEKNNDYAYYHIGEVDYLNHINSLKKFELSQDIEILSNKGAVTTFDYAKEDIELDLNGDRFGKFKTNHKGDISLSFWLSANDYSLPLGYKILGNYFEEGFGIFNTDFVTPNIFIPVGNKLLLLNNELEIYDEIEVLEGNTPVNIKGIGRKDNFSEFYILGENNVIYIYNSNPNLVSKVTNLSSYSSIVIDDIDVTKDRFYVGLNPSGSKGYFYYDSSDNSTHIRRSVSADSFGDKNKIFVNPANNAISFYKADSEIETGNEIAIDGDKNTYTIRQKSPTQRNIPYNLVYKNSFIDNTTNTIQVTGGNVESVLTNVIVDDEDYIITLHDKNRISKLKTTRELVTFKDLTFLDNNTTKYIDVILDFEGKNYVKYYLIVEKFSNKTLLHKIDKNFNLVKTKSLGSRVVNNLNLTKSITSYYFLKKYNACKNKLKVVLRAKPKFTKTGGFKKTEANIVYDISQLNSGYNHFAVNVSLKLGYMDLYVNGYKYQRRTFSPGTFLLDNPLGSGIFLGALSTPYYLTFSSRLQQPGKYFLRDLKLKGFKMYSKVLDFYEIRSHYNYHNFNRDTVWSLPIGQRTYIDTIDRVYKFNLPEKNTNTFDIDIKNLGITDTTLQQKIKDEIKKEIPKLVPYYDTLKDVNINS